MHVELVAAPIRSEEVRKGLAEAFLAAPVAQRFVFGTGSWSRAVARRVPVAGFIDDFRAGEEVDDLPVLAAPSAPSGAWAVNGSLEASPVSVSRRIAAVGLREVDYLTLRRFGGLDLGYPMFAAGARSEIEDHLEEYRELHDRLADEESRRVLQQVLSARWHEDLQFLASHRTRPDEQYFEEFLGLRPDGEHFLDVGAYDGATSLGFAARHPGYARITALEPHPGLAEGVRAALAPLRDVEVIEAGAGEEPSTLRFRSAGSASSLDEHGDIEVRIEAIDDVVGAGPTFIKMDIEGAEVPALRGARGCIAAGRPVLAICVYHRVDDLRTIPAAIDAMGVGYRFHLRHYTEGVTETVLFAVPDGR